MDFRATAIPDVVVIEPRVFGDDRGFFFESFHRRKLEAALGRELEFVQDNHSHSARRVLRGLHFQAPHSQGKLVRVVLGEIFDVAVDLRRDSPTVGQHVAERLSAANAHQLWIPEGFAHGFLVLSDGADVLYKATDYWSPEDEHTIRWDDPDLAIPWPLEGAPVVSPKDAGGIPFRQVSLSDRPVRPR